MNLDSINNIQFEHNFYSLFNRKRHQCYYVVNGAFKELKGIKYLQYIVSKKFRESVQQNLSHEISKILKVINLSLEKGEGSNTSKYKTLIFDKLSRLSTKIFDRSILETPDCQNLVHMLDEDYQKIEAAEINYTEDEGYLQKVEKVAKFALKLGIKPEAVSEGSSGTYFLKDLFNRNIAVFKPSDEEVLAERAPKCFSQTRRILVNIVRRIVNFCQTAIFSCSGNGYKSEISASILSQELGLNNVPLTKLSQLAHPLFHYSAEQRRQKSLPLKQGSLQVFIKEEGLGTPETVLKISRYWCAFPKIAQWRFRFRNDAKRIKNLMPQDEFEKMAIIDILTGNLDRHFGNCLMAKKKIYCIDNGYGMSKKHSDSYVSRLNQYIWAILPSAKKHFSAASNQKIQEIKEKMPEIIRLLTQPQGDSSVILINEDQKEKLIERVAMLYAKRDLTIREIAQYKSTKDFEKLKTDKAYLDALNEIKRACVD